MTCPPFPVVTTYEQSAENCEKDVEESDTLRAFRFVRSTLTVDWECSRACERVPNSDSDAPLNKLEPATVLEERE